MLGLTGLSMSIRKMSSKANCDVLKKALLLGVYGEKNAPVTLTSTALEFDNEQNGKLSRAISVSVPELNIGSVRVFHDLCPEFGAVAVVGLGSEKLDYNEQENIQEDREAVRKAVAAGCKSLQNLDKTEIWVEGMCIPDAAGEAATLGLWQYQEHKNPEKRKTIPEINYYRSHGESCILWDVGVLKGTSQNIARRLTDTPANLMTPTIFAKEVEKIMSKLDVTITVHDAAWAKEMKMGAFLGVAKGSDEPPLFLELSFKKGKPENKPIVLVGKGVTFDSGGISIKHAAKMDLMRGDMGGAACIVAAMYCLASLDDVPLNVVGLIPLCENMPSGKALKPGDIVTAMNGKTIQVDNTDAEGRLILADALCYASSFDPFYTIDVATLTGAIGVALGSSATGAFSNSDVLWQTIEKAGAFTGDRVWRLPLWDCFSKEMTDTTAADVNNLGKGKGGSCTAAAFLKEFAPPGEWMHLDIAGVSAASDGISYLNSGMTGRPTRTLIETLLDTVKRYK